MLTPIIPPIPPPKTDDISFSRVSIVIGSPLKINAIEVMTRKIKNPVSEPTARPALPEIHDDIIPDISVATPTMPTVQ